MSDRGIQTPRGFRHEWHEISRYAALCKRLRISGRGSSRYCRALGRPLLARGSTRPNRSPICCCAIARSVACSKNIPIRGAVRRISSWNAVIVCSVRLKFSCRGRFSCASPPGPSQLGSSCKLVNASRSPSRPLPATCTERHPSMSGPLSSEAVQIFVSRASRTSPSPSASVDLAHLRPLRGRIGCATRNTSSEPEAEDFFPS